ncbi:tyrosine-type recombinase/integrase [Curtobacterium sp. 20TX0008]|uniref:tyrosine-type recombinase/integrase n=1 Tax=Curtobacterium sp. 20TX0008 TaxID=3022018 RepID=UPI00232EC1B3|nr:tyrosine-type recombinase/integrase [Curtobacterium sp. 20TX0008]MDB6425847.1 tyrosine-type recombinase/integrase [Curtobacterium sp. 20TX0008]
MSVEKTAAGSYRVRIYHRGKQVTSRTFQRKKEAEAWELSQRALLASGAWTNPRNGDVPLGEVIQEFLEERRGLVSQHTFDTDEANLRLHVPTAMKRRPLASLNRQVLRRFVNELTRTKKYGTAKRIRESLSAVLAYAVQMEYLPHNPITEVRLERGDGTEDREIRPFSDDEFATMLEAQRSVNRPYADIVEFLRETGLRWGEMKALRVADVRSAPFPAVFVSRSKSDGYPEKQTKGRRSRTVPLLGRAADIVSARAAGTAPDAFLFRAPGGGELSGPNFTRDVHWAATAGTHRLHDLRHTAATSWLRDGIDVKTISVWLGHSTTQQTVNRYSHWMSSDSDLAAVAKALDARRSRTTDR